MKIIEAFATNNKCYQVGATIKPQGIMLHSIGAPQPSAKAMAKAYNVYQPNGASACVHAFIDTETCYQIMPWDRKAWHCGASANSTHISVEMTEPATIKYTSGAKWVETSDGKNTKAHVMATYKNAVELFAMLCKIYNLDPLKDGVIISHSEGYKRGIASNHGDVEHIWQRFGLSMDQFRKDVKAKMTESKKGKYFVDTVGHWAEKNIDKCKEAGIMNGVSADKFAPNEPVTRAQLATVIARMLEKQV